MLADCWYIPCQNNNYGSYSYSRLKPVNSKRRNKMAIRKRERANPLIMVSTASRAILWAVILAIMTVLIWPGTLPAATEDTAPGREMAKQATKDKESWITAEHSKHEALQKEFKSGPEVTKACLSCHNQAALQFHKTIHWTWMDPITEKGAKLGKGGLSINNF